MIFRTKHKGTKQLSTVRLTLRPFAPQDAESCLRNWAADEEIYRYLSAQPQTADEVREWLSSADEAYADPRTYYWAIEETHCGEVVGELFVDNFGTSSRRCEMDWKIGTAFQGKGYAAEAARAAIEYLIREVGFHRIEAKCCTENTASERVMQKLGINKEGILRERFCGKDGRWHDLAEYSLLAHDL